MRSQIASGAGWMLLFRLVDRSLGVVSTVILARLLVPQDFGIVAMAMSVIGILELATSLSFDVALIQREDIERVHYDTAWTLNVLLAIVCGLGITLLAYPTALFYDEPRLTELMLLLAVGWTVAGLENVGVVDFRRHLDFRREFWFMSARRVFAFAITTALAFALHSYWALVLGTVAGKLLGVVLSYAMHPYRPRPTLKAAGELFGFSSWVVGTNILNALQQRVPHFVVGRLMGASSLGVLTIGTEIGQLAASDLMAPINRAVFPGYSRMGQDPSLLRSLFLDVMGVVMLVAVPTALGIAAVADPLVRTLLGVKWLEAVPVIQVLALASAVTAATSNNAVAYLAIGRPGLNTGLNAARFVLLVPLTLLLTDRFGLVGAAIAWLASTIILMCIGLPLLFSKLQLKYSAYFSRMWRPIAASSLMAYLVTEAVGAIHGQSAYSSAFALIVGTVLGMVVYLITVVLLWALSGRPPGAEAILLRRVQAAVGRKASPAA